MPTPRFITRLLNAVRPRGVPRRRDSVAEFAEFPEMNPGPVLRLTLEGMVVRANSAAVRLFSGVELLGSCWFDLCPEITRAWWVQAIDSREPLEREVLVGERCLVFSHAHRPGSDFMFVFGTDLTARRRAERQLAAQAGQLAEMARFPEMNPGPVARLNRDGTIVLANAAARAIFGDEALLGKCWLDVCPDMTGERWQAILAADQHVYHEARVGERYFVFAHTPGTAGSEVFAYGTDLTEQRLAERALGQSEKMATLGTLAAGVAHELNNPAAAAQRAAEHLRDEFAKLETAQIDLGRFTLTPAERDQLVALDQRARTQATCACEVEALERSDREEALETWLEARGVPDAWEAASALVEFNVTLPQLGEVEQRVRPELLAPLVVWLSHAAPVYRLLEEIRQGAGRVSEIVGALKAYSYVGQGPVHAVDINQGLRNTLIILRSKLKGAIVVEQDLAPDLPHILGYGGELNQVWTNIIDNAVGALDGTGHIRLRTRLEGQRVAVEIEDDGPGIPEGVQSRIFDAFFTTKAPGQGTGLGLNTSYKIVVQRHGGTIDVASRPGHTRFTVKLPVKAPGRAPAPATA